MASNIIYLLPNLFPKTRRPALERLQYSTQLVPGDFSQGVKRPGLEVEQSLPSTAEVMCQATLLVIFNDFILFTGTTLHSTFPQRLPRGLWRGSAAARLLRLRVRISPRA